MSIFVVQARGTDATALTRARFIKDGFSWPAFAFGGLWLLYHRLWLPLLAYVVLEVAFVALLAPHLNGGAVLVVDLLVHLYLGSEGNRWRQSQGAHNMAINDIVEARDRDEAEAIFYGRQAAERPGLVGAAA